jgi:hypothetical protein
MSGTAAHRLSKPAAAIEANVLRVNLFAGKRAKIFSDRFPGVRLVLRGGEQAGSAQDCRIASPSAV